MEYVPDSICLSQVSQCRLYIDGLLKLKGGVAYQAATPPQWTNYSVEAGSADSRWRGTSSSARDRLTMSRPRNTNSHPSISLNGNPFITGSPLLPGPFPEPIA